MQKTTPAITRAFTGALFTQAQKLCSCFLPTLREANGFTVQHAQSHLCLAGYKLEKCRTSQQSCTLSLPVADLKMTFENVLENVCKFQHNNG
jgi:hypothetical protein